MRPAAMATPGPGGTASSQRCSLQTASRLKHSLIPFTKYQLPKVGPQAHPHLLQLGQCVAVQASCLLRGPSTWQALQAEACFVQDVTVTFMN